MECGLAGGAQRAEHAGLSRLAGPKLLPPSASCSPFPARLLPSAYLQLAKQAEEKEAERRAKHGKKGKTGGGGKQAAQQTQQVAEHSGELDARMLSALIAGMLPFNFFY